MVHYLPRLNASAWHALQLGQVMRQMGDLSLERLEDPSFMQERLVVSMARCTPAYAYGACEISDINPEGFTDTHRIFVPVWRMSTRALMVERITSLLLCKAGMAVAANRRAHHSLDRGMLFVEGYTPFNTCTPEYLAARVDDEIAEEIQLAPDTSPRGMDAILQTTLNAIDLALCGVAHKPREVMHELVARFAHSQILRGPVLVSLAPSMTRLLDGSFLEGCTPVAHGTDTLRRL